MRYDGDVTIERDSVPSGLLPLLSCLPLVPRLSSLALRLSNPTQQLGGIDAARYADRCDSVLGKRPETCLLRRSAAVDRRDLQRIPGPAVRLTVYVIASGTEASQGFSRRNDVYRLGERLRSPERSRDLARATESRFVVRQKRQESVGPCIFQPSELSLQPYSPSVASMSMQRYTFGPAPEAPYH